MIGKPLPASSGRVSWSLMMSSSPWAKLLRLVPGTGMKPGSGPPLLMSNAKTVRVRASGAAVPRGAAAAAPAVPAATASAALPMIAARLC